MRQRWRTIAALGAVMAGFGFAGSSGAATPTITESPTGGGSQPQAIVPGADGKLWSTWSGTRKLGIGTTDGAITSTPDSAGQFPTNILPLDIASGSDGNLWFTAASANSVVRVLSASPHTYTSFPTGAINIVAIAAGPDGNLWFTDSSGERIGRITTTGSVQFYPLSGDPGGMYAIAAGPDGNLWFTQSGANEIGRIKPNGEITEYPIATAGSSPYGITAGPDGKIWFTENAGNRIGRIDPSTATPTSPGITEYPIPTADSRPTDIATGPDGKIWFTENAGNKIGRITPEGDPPSFTDSARIAVPGPANPATGNGPADRYPATITASGLQGTVTAVTVRLNGIHHSWGGDIQAQLVGPQGQTTYLTGGRSVTGELNRDRLDGEVITFAKGGRTAPTRLTSGIFTPFGDANPVALPPLAPGTTNQNLSVFDGTNPNGDWKLYVNDKASGDVGAIVGGWSLDIKTTGPPAVVPGQSGGGGGSTGQGVQPSGNPTASVFTPRDTTKPKLKLAKLAAKTTLARFLKGTTASVTPNETSTVKCTLATTARKPKTLATATRKGAKAGKATKCTLKPSKKKLGKPKKAFKVKLSIAAMDAAGNKGTSSKTITVKP